jgi:hypothetical protein
MAGYTRQSSYTDGDVINAADSNNEFNQVLAAFVNTSGHKHDGTAAEGPVIGLIGDPGVATPLNKVVVDDTNNRVGLFLDAGGAGSSVEQIRFQDGVIVPVTDNDIDLGTSSLEFKNAFFDGTVTTDAIVVNSTIGHDDDTDLLTLANGIVTVAGEISTTTLDIGGTNVTATAAELNIMDGDTSATSTTVADADRVVFNDGGTMKQVAVTDLAAYFDDEITAMPNLTSVGTLTTLTVDNVIINGTTIGHTDDTDLITLADGIATVAGEVSMTTLDIGGTNVTATAAELNILDGVTATAAELNIMDGVTATTAELNLIDGVTATTTEINILDGDTSATSTTLADADRVIVNDGGTMKQVALTDFETYFEGAIDTLDTSVFTSQTAETSVASDDVVLIFDTSASAFRKMTRSNFVAGLATSSAISNLSEDSTPQLGGNLDTNSHNILIDDAHFIADESGNEQIIFQTTGSAVNQFDITNAASSGAPKLSATGDDSNIDLDLEAKGTGHVTVRGNTNPGAIQFNCESNSHGQIVKSQPHSASVTNVLTLPAGSDQEIVGASATQTLTNKTLTSPTISAPAVTGTATFGGSSGVSISQGAISIKNGGTQSYVDFYCESSNAHYARLQAPAHASFGGNITLTLPATTDTIAGIAATQTLTNKTLTSPTINGGSLSSAVTATTQSAGTSSTTIATTAFAQTAASNEAVALAIALG